MFCFCQSQSLGCPCATSQGFFEACLERQSRFTVSSSRWVAIGGQIDHIKGDQQIHVCVFIYIYIYYIWANQYDSYTWIQGMRSLSLGQIYMYIYNILYIYRLLYNQIYIVNNNAYDLWGKYSSTKKGCSKNGRESLVHVFNYLFKLYECSGLIQTYTPETNGWNPQNWWFGSSLLGIFIYISGRISR